MNRTVAESGRLLGDRVSEVQAFVVRHRDLVEKIKEVGRDTATATAAVKRLRDLQRTQHAEIERLRVQLEAAE